MITIINNKKSEIDFTKHQLLKDKTSELVIITNGKTSNNLEGLFIEGTVVNGTSFGYVAGDFNRSWRSDIWEKFTGSVKIYSSDND